MGEVDAGTLIVAVRERAVGGDTLVLLETAILVAGEVSGAADELIEHYVGAARSAGVSWTLIGERLGVSKQAARQRFAHRLEAGDLAGDGASVIDLSPRLSDCLQAAQVAADTEASVPGTQHLLLGLLHTGGAASILDRLGVNRAGVREASARLLEPVMIIGEDNEERRVVGDGQAGQAVTSARRLAARRGLSQVDTEHLLSCVALDPGSSARRIVNALGIDPAQVKKELADWTAPVQRRHRRTAKNNDGDMVRSVCGGKNPGP